MKVGIEKNWGDFSGGLSRFAVYASGSSVVTPRTFILWGTAKNDGSPTYMGMKEIFTPARWVEIMTRQGLQVVQFKTGDRFCCQLIDDGELYAYGFHEGSRDDAIRACRDMFGVKNLMREMDRLNTREQQKANAKAVKNLLSKNT